MRPREFSLFPTFFVGLVGLFTVGMLMGLTLVTRGQTPEPMSESVEPVNKNVVKPPPNMDSRIFEWIQRFENEGVDSARAYAREQQLEMDNGDFIRFVVEFDHRSSLSTSGIAPRTQIEARRESVINLIEELGGRVETMHDVRIQAYLGPGGLRRLAEMPYIRFIRPPMKPIPMVVSEGVERVGAREWQNARAYHVSAAPRVAVLDLGFKNYRSLQGSELPSNLITRSFHLRGIEAGDVHGTACAEIIYDMAPGLSSMWLVNFDSDVAHSNAVDYLIQQGVDVISYSIGWFNFGAGDGTGPINEDVNRAVQSGISWIVAAGNTAYLHWEETFKDPDGDGLHNFGGGDNSYEMITTEGRTCVYLNWNDWGTWDGMNYSGSDQDYDLYIYKWFPFFGYILYTRSINLQSGWQWPVEAACVYSSGFYRIVIVRYRASRAVNLELFFNGPIALLERVKAEGSITIPADSKVALAVGAVDWSDDSYHWYSSRGPTSDGRIKPDLSAPSRVANVTFGRFSGTSAAAPHVAGALALMKMKTPFTMRQLESILLNRVLDLGPRGPDNRFGKGRLKMTP